ncbi:MAG: hypothetical protein RL369_27 [Pseudomonadota bacterium]|jgi:hypothetical protein
MRYVLINNLITSSRRARHQFLARLQPPPASERMPRKDHTGFIMILLTISFCIAVYLMA